MELREALKTLRGELGLSQSELANALHVSFASVSRWEAGKTYPHRSVLSALADYAQSQELSADCRRLLREAIADAKKAKVSWAKQELFAVEPAALSQLIEDASFPIYICDLETDQLLYVNHQTEKALGLAARQLLGRPCYECLGFRDSPCPFCHKEELNAEGFTTFQAFDPRDNSHHLVQAKLIQWHGRQARVRYIADVGSALDLASRSQREAAYAEQLQLRRELAGDAISVAHYNLTHNTVADVVSLYPEHAAYLTGHGLDDLLLRLSEEAFSAEDSQALAQIADRKSMIQQFYTGKTHLTVRHYISGREGVFEGTFDLMQNPVTFDIEAFGQLHDVTEAAMTEAVAQRLFQIDYETITTIDAVSGQARPYLGSYIRGLIREQQAAGDNVAGLAAYLRKYCADRDVDSVIRRTSLDYVKEQLAAKDYYHTTYSLRREGKPVYARAIYTYLDRRQTTILCAIQDLTDLHAAENSKRDQLAAASPIPQATDGPDSPKP